VRESRLWGKRMVVDVVSGAMGDGGMEGVFYIDEVSNVKIQWLVRDG